MSSSMRVHYFILIAVIVVAGLCQGLLFADFVHLFGTDGCFFFPERNECRCFVYWFICYDAGG